VRPGRDVLARKCVREVMKPCISFVSPRDLATRARSVMRSTGARTLPVVEDGRLVGLITARHLLQIKSTRSNIPVSGVMIPAALIATPEQSVLELCKRMLELDVSIAPVVRGAWDQTLVGVVGLEDVLSHLAGLPKLKELGVGEVMSKRVVTCGPDDPIPKVWGKMEETRLSGLPVTRYDRGKRITEVIGVVTRSDIVKSGYIRFGEEAERGRSRFPPLVKAIMRTPAITVSPATPLADAIKLMVERNVGRLPVVERDNLVGILDREDIIKAYM